MANKPHEAACGSCGAGQPGAHNPVYVQEQVTQSHKVKQPDGSWKTETYKVWETVAKKCPRS